MSATGSNLAQQQRAVIAGIPALIFWIAAVSLLPVAALLGGMAMVLIGLAVCLAVLVYQRPAEAPGAAMLYLFGSSILLPYSSRFDFTLQSSEMYYWAAGLLIITTGAVARLGLRRVLTVPLSARVFLVVAFAAAVYGETHGAATSYVLRQLYGVLLLIVYFGIARNAGDQELLLRRIQTFGVLCACCFFAYYISVFHIYGFHKEMGFNNTQASLLAIILFITGLEREKYAWVFGGLALLLVPILLFQRGDVLTFVMALPAALALKLRSMTLRLLCYSAIVLVALPATLPPVAQYVGEQLAKVPVIGENLPAGVFAADSLADRTVQLAAAASTVQAHPWLGSGLGSFLGFESIGLGYEETGYVDSGWGYLLQKMGLLGLAAFVWFLVTVMRRMSREALALSACLLAATLVRMFSQPVFLHFTTAPFIGTIAGMLYAKRRNLPTVIMAKQQM
jgi:O-antigen ligase